MRLRVLGLLASFAVCYVIIGCAQDSGRMGWKSRAAFIDAMISRFSQLAKPQRPCISLDSLSCTSFKISSCFNLWVLDQDASLAHKRPHRWGTGAKWHKFATCRRYSTPCHRCHLRIYATTSQSVFVKTHKGTHSEGTPTLLAAKPPSRTPIGPASKVMERFVFFKFRSLKAKTRCKVRAVTGAREITHLPNTWTRFARNAGKGGGIQNLWKW